MTAEPSSIHPLPRPPVATSDDRWALFVDIDGTIVDFAPRPEAVNLNTSVVRTLGDLFNCLDGALAILSGRCLEDVDRLLSPMRLPAGAMHGIERRDPDGRVTMTLAPAEIAELVLHESARVAARLDGVWLEAKRGQGFALHCRGAPQHESDLRRSAERIAAMTSGHYVVQRGNHVVELKPAGRDKGSALRSLLSVPPFLGRRPIVLGDDLTDEAAFLEAIRADGFGIIVGPRRPTHAHYALPTTLDAQSWLQRVAENMRQGGLHDDAR